MNNIWYEVFESKDLGTKTLEVCQNLTYSHDVLDKILQETVSNQSEKF